MSELSEEEKLINYLNSIDITRVFYDNPPHDNHVGIGKALQGLLDLYQKEKEKNKELEKENSDMKNLFRVQSSIAEELDFGTPDKMTKFKNTFYVPYTMEINERIGKPKRIDLSYIEATKYLFN